MSNVQYNTIAVSTKIAKINRQVKYVYLIMVKVYLCLKSQKSASASASFLENCVEQLKGVYNIFHLKCIWQYTTLFWFFDSLWSHLSPAQPEEQPPWQVPVMWSHGIWFRQFPHWREHSPPYWPFGHSLNTEHERMNCNKKLCSFL